MNATSVREDFARCYEQFAPRGLRYAYSILRNAADSEEVVHEAFYRLMRARKAPSTLNGSFAPVFFTTIRNLCIDAHRASRRRPSVPLESADVAVVHPSLEPDLHRQVCEAIERLPPCWADALKLRVNGELTYEQIAGVLGCSHAQVRTWIYRARRQLSEELQ